MSKTIKKSPRRLILHLNPKEKCCVILLEEILEELLLERASNSRHFLLHFIVFKNTDPSPIQNILVYFSQNQGSEQKQGWWLSISMNSNRWQWWWWLISVVCCRIFVLATFSVMLVIFWMYSIGHQHLKLVTNKFLWNFQKFDPY